MTNNGKVIFGSTVTVITGDNDVQVTYQLVGDEEGDIKKGRLSISAPIVSSNRKRSGGYHSANTCGSRRI